MSLEKSQQWKERELLKARGEIYGALAKCWRGNKHSWPKTRVQAVSLLITVNIAGEEVDEASALVLWHFPRPHRQDAQVSLSGGKSRTQQSCYQGSCTPVAAKGACDSNMSRIFSRTKFRAGIQKSFEHCDRRYENWEFVHQEPPPSALTSAPATVPPGQEPTALLTELTGITLLCFAVSIE